MSLARVEEPRRSRILHDDSEFSFWGRDYGPGGVTTPGLFVFRKDTGTWMQITSLSTAGATLGHSPPFSKVPLAISWDFAPMRGRGWPDVPLLHGFVHLPDEIVRDSAAGTYAIRLHTKLARMYHIDGVVTEFIVSKNDLDHAFVTATAPESPR